MKRIFLCVALVIAIMAEAQVKTVSLQASGLTCSMCSNSINKALKALDFIERVNADLKTYTFQIFFKGNSVVDFDLIKKSVEKAGFSVSAFVATIYFDNVYVQSNVPARILDNTFVFLNCKEQLLNGDQQVKFIDKGFIPAKEYKSVSTTAQIPNLYHVTL